MVRNKKLILLVFVILAIWVFSNYRPNLYLFAITTLPDFPKSISVGGGGSAGGCNSISYSPLNIPNLYGDYIFTMSGDTHAYAAGGRSDAAGQGSGSFSVQGQGVGCGISSYAKGCNHPNCGYPNTWPSQMRDDDSGTIEIITNTETNTFKCIVNGVEQNTQNLPTTGVYVYMSASCDSSNYASGSGSVTVSSVTIEDTSSKRFVEYNIYDVFDEPTLNPARWTSSGTIESRFGKIFLNPGTLNMLENMKGRIVYFEYETTGSGSISLSDNQGNSYSLNLGGQEAGVIKLESSPLYPDKMYWFFRGKQVKEIDYSTVNKVTFSISGTNVFIDNVGFRVLFQTCSLGKNQFLAYETFTGPRTISHYSARKMIQQYCINLPPVLKKGTGFEEVPELIGILANGKTYNVVSGDTVILPYIYTKTDTETLPCIPGSGQIFDVETNTCKDINGITFFCSEGTWNPTSYSCEVYPEIKYICDGVLDLTDPTNPVCLWHVPSQAICDHPNATYDEALGKCLRYVPSLVDCESYETYDPQRDACVATPIKLINCPINTAYDSELDKCIGTREILLENKTVIIQNETFTTVSAQLACIQSSGRWDSNKKVCILNAPQVYTCPLNSFEKIVNNQKVCINTLGTEVQPSLSKIETDSSFPLWLFIIGSLLLIYFIFEIGPNRGFFRRRP